MGKAIAMVMVAPFLTHGVEHVSSGSRGATPSGGGVRSEQCFTTRTNIFPKSENAI